MRNPEKISESPASSCINRRSAVKAMTTNVLLAAAALCTSGDTARREEKTENVSPRVHSGPFHVESFTHDVCFLDDGFTIAFADRQFRMEHFQAFFSDMTAAQAKQTLGSQGITHIHCANGLTMCSGTDRKLCIAHGDFVRVLQAMEHSSDDTVVIAGIPYTLHLETSISSLFIPRTGDCTMTFHRVPDHSVILASTITR